MENRKTKLEKKKKKKTTTKQKIDW
jgi:hypothetical protein